MRSKNLENLKRLNALHSAKVQSEKSSENSSEKEDSESIFSSTNDLLGIGCKISSNHDNDPIYPSVKSTREEEPCNGSVEYIPGSSDHLPLADLAESTHGDDPGK